MSLVAVLLCESWRERSWVSHRCLFMYKILYRHRDLWWKCNDPPLPHKRVVNTVTSYNWAQTSSQTSLCYDVWKDIWNEEGGEYKEQCFIPGGGSKLSMYKHCCHSVRGKKPSAPRMYPLTLLYFLKPFGGHDENCRVDDSLILFSMWGGTI